MIKEIRQDKILKHIGYGSENAITAAEIAKRSGSTQRQVSKAIGAARQRRIPICASTSAPFGFYLASNDDDLKEYISSVKHRVNEISKSCIALESLLCNSSGQTIILIDTEGDNGN